MADKLTKQSHEKSKLDELLAELGGLLAPLQQKAQVPQKPEWPVLCIVGNPRSGSTLLLQALAATQSFSYPSNFLTRFAYSPYVGARIQQMLFDEKYDPHSDFADIRSNINFESDLGKSKGALATNEFQHFFRNFIPAVWPRCLSDEELARTDFRGIARGLASLEYAFGKPFVTKAVLLQFNIPIFAEYIDKLVFLHIKRQPLQILQSLLIAREHYYGSRKAWWSVRPKEYNQLKDLDVYHQIAGQVYFTETAITEGLQSVPESNQLTIDYEAFCADPESIYDRIVEKYSLLGCELPVECKGPKVFKCRNEIRLPKEDIDGLQRAYEDFASGAIAFG